MDVTGKGSSASASSSASGTAIASGNLTDGTQLFVESAGSTTASGSAKSSSPSGLNAAGTIQNTAFADEGESYGPGSDINETLGTSSLLQPSSEAFEERVNKIAASLPSTRIEISLAVSLIISPEAFVLPYL
jgi:hypothetical protein